MPVCPEYYVTSNGDEFYQFFAKEIGNVARELIDHDQYHALASACEYLFRAGRKTIDFTQDMQKFESLIERIRETGKGFGAEEQQESAICYAVSRTMTERIKTMRVRPKFDNFSI